MYILCGIIFTNKLCPRDLPSPEGLKAHIALSKIAGYIVTNTYQIAPPEGEDRFRDAISLVTEPLQRLDQWREKLPPELQIPLELPPEVQIPLDDTPMDEGLPMDRSLCVLYMKWNQVRPPENPSKTATEYVLPSSFKKRRRRRRRRERSRNKKKKKKGKETEKEKEIYILRVQ